MCTAGFLSLKDDDHATRLSVTFVGVEEMSVPTNFFCTSIEWEEAGADDVKKYALRGDDREYYMLALNLHTEEDDLEYNDPLPHFL